MADFHEKPRTIVKTGESEPMIDWVDGRVSAIWKSEGDRLMHRYQKWLSVGLLALTPGISAAAALDSPQLKSSQRSVQAVERPAKRTKAAANQELAEKVARVMRKTKLNGYDIEIDVSDGVVTLDGVVNGKDQRIAAAKAASSVPGVKAINNRLRVAEPDPKLRDEQSAAGQPGTPATSRRVRQANYQTCGASGHGQSAAVQHTGGGETVPLGTMGPPTQAAMTAYGTAAAGASYAAYNQPNLPNNAWPTYAQYPNYAAVTYPSQYSASAWPYIGPFYPYPQVPLGWRKATLEWDGGLWKMNVE
jgi:hypothetical protein